MNIIDFSQARRWAAVVSAASIAIPAPAWAASGGDGSWSGIGRDAFYILVWSLGAFGLSLRDLTILAAAVAILGLISWVTIKVFYLGKRAAGG
jgi:hypothetical protein